MKKENNIEAYYKILLEKTKREYDLFLNLLRECRKCSRREALEYPIPGRGDIAADLMIIKTEPLDEGEDRNILSGKIDEVLKIAFKKLEIDYDKNIYYTNVLKCRSRSKIMSEDILKCSAWISYEIEIVSPGVIFAMGEPSIQAIQKISLLGYNKINYIPGKVFEWNSQVKILPTYDIMTVVQENVYKKELWRDFKILSQMLGKPRY